MILSSTLGLVDTAYAIFPYAEKQMKQTQGCIHKNADGERSNADLLDRMLVLQQKNPDLLTDTEIKKICAMLVFVGSDTTFVLFMSLSLPSHPDALKLTVLPAPSQSPLSSNT